MDPEPGCGVMGVFSEWGFRTDPQAWEGIRFHGWQSDTLPQSGLVPQSQDKDGLVNLCFLDRLLPQSQDEG